MITKDGKFVPTRGNKALGYRDRQEIRQNAVGVTVTSCAVCGNDTPLLYRSYLTIGSTEVITTQGRFDPSNNFKWTETHKVSRRPIQKQYWVCDKHHTNRTGKPIIQVREVVDERFLKHELKDLKDTINRESPWKDSPLTGMYNRVKAMKGEQKWKP